SVVLRDRADLAELGDDLVRAGQVLQVVAHEDEVEVAVRDRLAQRQAVGLHEVHVRAESCANIADVGRPALACADVADEVAEVAGHVENSTVAGYPTLEVRGDLRPEAILRARVGVPEAVVVDPIELGLARHALTASSSARIHGITSSSIASRVVVASKPRT